MPERGKVIPLDSIGGDKPHKCENQSFHNSIQIFVAAASFEATIRASQGQDIQHYVDVIAEQFPQLDIIPRGQKRTRRRSTKQPE